MVAHNTSLVDTNRVFLSFSRAVVSASATICSRLADDVRIWSRFRGREALGGGGEVEREKEREEARCLPGSILVLTSLFMA